MNGEYNFVTTDELFGKIELQLSQYSNTGTIDTNLFFSEVKLVVSKLGIAAYEMVDAIVTLENHRAGLPCNFYLLDSAWLCDHSPASTQAILQSNFVMYTETIDEEISQKVCSSNNTILDVTNNGVTIQSTACNNNNENVLHKTTIKEYVVPEGRTITWRNPILMTLNNKKSIGSPVCTKDCKNLFAKSPYEISITQQGVNKFLHSTLEKPVIYLKYYAYPEDPNTGLPLIPDIPIIQRAIEYHLMHYFFYMAYLNNTDVNLERKLQMLRQDRDMYMREALNYSVMPSFNKSIEMARKTRKKWAAYNLIDSRHI